MCSCNVLAIKQRKINFGRQRSAVDNLRLVWVIQKGQTGQALSCKRGELKTENLYLYHSRKSKIFALHCSLGYLLPNLANWILKRSNLDIFSCSSTNWIYLLLPFKKLNISAPSLQQIGYICSFSSTTRYICSCSSTNWISAPAPLLRICPHLLHPDPAYFQPQQFCLLPCSISCVLLYLLIIARSFPPPPIPATLVCIQPQLYVFAPLLNIS